MEKYFLFALIAIIALWYLSYSATRLDRLHHRVETSWANLDGLLQRRAAVALEIAKSELADPASSLLLTAADSFTSREWVIRCSRIASKRWPFS